MSKFDALALPVDRPARMKLVHPVSGRPLLDAGGEPFWIDLLPMESEAARKHQRKMADERIDAAVRTKINLDDIEAKESAALAAVTVDWRLGAPPKDEAGRFTDDPAILIDVLFTVADARDLYSERSVSWIREQVAVFLANRANFYKGSSKN